MLKQPHFNEFKLHRWIWMFFDGTYYTYTDLVAVWHDLHASQGLLWFDQTEVKYGVHPICVILEQIWFGNLLSEASRLFHGHIFETSLWIFVFEFLLWVFLCNKHSDKPSGYFGWANLRDFSPRIVGSFCVNANIFDSKLDCNAI